MLTISADFLKKVPISSLLWTEEVIDGVPYIVLKNPTLCQVFWMFVWRHKLAEEFRAQKVYTLLEYVDLSRAVYINPSNGTVISSPKSANSINYFAYANKQDHYFDNMLFSKLGLVPLIILFIIVTISMIVFSSLASKHDFLTSPLSCL